MSDLQGPTLEPIIILTGSPESSPVTKTFKDGEHTITEAVVAHLGGPEAVMKMNGLEAVTFANFMKGFHRAVEKAQLNSIQQNFLSNCFGGRV